MEKAYNESVEAKVNAALDMIRPYLQADGGDISLVEVTEDLSVRVKLLGACGSCDISYQTLKAGVETTVRRLIPNIKEVVAVK